MATAKNHLAIEFSTTLTLDETEIRALDALAGYGDTAFLKAFKEKLGEVYIRDHEKGLRSFFEAIRREVLPRLYEIDQAREDLDAAAAMRRSAAQSNKLAGE